LRRTLFLVALLFSWSPAAFVAVALREPLPEPGVSRESFQRLSEGMTDKEVQAVFGEPGHIPSLRFRPLIKTWKREETTASLQFRCEDGTLLGGFLTDREGKVWTHEIWKDEETFLENVRRWVCFWQRTPT